MADHYPMIEPTTEGFIVGKHDLNDTQDKDGRTYPGTKLGAKLKAEGKITAEGRRPSDPKHAKG